MASERLTQVSEAALIAWCRANRHTTIAGLFFGMVDRGMPLFATDDEALKWLATRKTLDPEAATLLGLMYEEGLGVEKSEQ